MDNNSVTLKSSVFGGFKKKDVLSYIFELNESTQEAQQKFAEQIEELDRSRTELGRTVADLESRLASVQASLDDATHNLDLERSKCQEMSEMLEKLKTDAQRREHDLSDKENEIIQISTVNSELQEKNRLLEEERAQVELAASQIADLLNEARIDADNLVSGAREEAGKITDDAQNRVKSIEAGAKAAADKYINEANSSVNEIYGKFGIFTDELESLGKILTGLSADAAKVGESLPEKLAPDIDTFLSYEKTESSSPSESVSMDDTIEKATSFAHEVLGRYGVHKDDSGFFRLSAEKS